MGLIFTPKLSIRRLAAQAKKAIFAINSCQKVFGFFNINEHFRLFDSMVTPILTYGSEISGVEPIDVIKAVHIHIVETFLVLINQ